DCPVSPWSVLGRACHPRPSIPALGSFAVISLTPTAGGRRQASKRLPSGRSQGGFTIDCRVDHEAGVGVLGERGQKRVQSRACFAVEWCQEFVLDPFDDFA